jgi:hypothetical protein
MSLLVAVGLVLSAAMAQPAPRASADEVHCDVGLSIVLNVLGVAPAACGLGLDPGTGTYCRLTNVNVAVETNGAHGYQFDLINGTIGPCNLQVKASYNPATKQANEQLTGNGSRVQALWACSDDPWIFLPGQAPSCHNLGMSVTNADGTGGNVPSMTFPVSAQTLLDSDRHVLNAQLQNAIKQADAEAKAAQTQANLTHISTSPACMGCVIAGQINSTTPSPAPAPSPLPAPAGFSGQRDNLYGTTDVLSWQSVPGADYYKLTAQSHGSATPLTVSGGDDIPASATGFVVSGTAAEVQDGTDFFLQACSVVNGCGAKAQTTVVGP